MILPFNRARSFRLANRTEPLDRLTLPRFRSFTRRVVASSRDGVDGTKVTTAKGACPMMSFALHTVCTYTKDQRHANPTSHGVTVQLANVGSRQIHRGV